MTHAQSQISHDIEQKSSSSRSDTLLTGLDLFGEHLSLHLDEPPLGLELRSLETLMMRDAEALGQVEERQETIGHLINELHGVDAVIDKYQGDKSSLIQILLDVQAQLHWLPKSALRWVSERLGVPLAQVYNIATFYKAFNLLPQGRHVVQVCLGTTCHVQGGPRLLGKVEQVLGIKPGDTTPDQKFTLQTVNCLGCCALGPVMVVDGDFHGKLAVTKVGEIFDKYD